MEDISIANNSESKFGSAELWETFGMAISCFEYHWATSVKHFLVLTTFRNVDPSV